MKKILSVGIFFTVVIVLVLGFYIISSVSNDSYDQELDIIKNIVRQDLKEYNMLKRIRNNRGENRGILEPEINFTKPEKLSYYQGFVTPNHPSVGDYVQSQDISDLITAYNRAVQWVWVSDSVLHNKIELWLKPKAFIEDTPNKTLYPNNPINGMASDCESQAYTLVSIIENIGFSKENIRVVIGEVTFSGQTSGHAWVQVYEDGNWFELEATSGPFWDEDINKLVSSVGADFEYFKTRPYPVERYYAFFNDIYYYNPVNGLKSNNLPSHWLITERRFSLKDLKALKQN